MPLAWRLPWTGRCRCDRVKLQVTLPPLLAMACHCTGCQRMSSSAFSLSLAIPNDGFAVTEGEVVKGGIQGEHPHLFCAFCKTWLFTRPLGAPFVNLRPTMLDDCRWYAPYIETYTSEMLPWAKTGAVRSYPRFPDASEYDALLAAYAAHGAKPG